MLRRAVGRVLAGVVATIGAAGPAFADVTAEYVGDGERERIVIEIADNGDLRVTTGDRIGEGYFLITDGRAYSVEAGPGGPLVTASEVEAHNFRRGLESGDIRVFTIEEDEQPEFIRFVPGGVIEAAGYRGTEYVPEQGSHTPVGLSDDPALAPLGQAYLRYQRAIDELSPSDEAVPDNLAELLAQRGVIRFWDRDLRSVSFEPIDPARFALPAEPLLLEQVLQAEASEPRSDRGDDSGHESSIVRALYFEQALYTLTRDGKLFRWTEGAIEGRLVDTPNRVGAICEMGAQLLIVTGNLERPGTVRLWSGAAGSWKQEGSHRHREEDPFLALDCSGSEPLLLTAKALRMPRSGTTIAIDSEKLGPGGYFTTLQHDGYLYVGSNAGEWGGGLRRFSLRSGESETIDASDPQELCGGALNMSCDPVTGLAVDPGRPDCVLASVGLVHFFPKGQVARICDGRIAIAYRKPYTLDPDWEAKPATEQESFSSVPFFSMASSEGAAWAVGNDGLYRFGGDERPAFAPFGRTKRWPGSRVDWSDSRFVLVHTDMNQAHSISGGSLILVPR